MPFRSCFLVLLGFFATGAGASVNPAVDPKGWLNAMDAASLPSQGLGVEKLQVVFGAAHLSIEEGILLPVRGPSEQPFEFLFLGKARFFLATDDPVESYQIELFTGSERLDEPVTRAVFAVATDGVVRQLIARPGGVTLTPDQSRQATELFKAWRSSREYRRSELRLRALQDALQEPDAERFAAAWLDSPRLGRFLLRVDPYVAERMAVEQFVGVRMGDADKEAWGKQLRREQSDGRFLGMDLEDWGHWDTWYAGRSTTKSDPQTAHSAFEPSHYDLEATIDENIASVEARATIDLVTRASSARTVELSLFPDLIVDSIALRGGAALPWSRSKSEIIAVLPAPVASGATLAIEIRYHGVLFDRDESKLIVKRTTTIWYPHVGSIDRATYKGTFTVPGPYGLLGSGRVVEDTPAGAKHRQVWVLDKPTDFFGFEVGKFDIVERKLGHVDLTVGFVNDTRKPSALEREAVIGTLRDALATYEDAFGPYPIDTLCVATSEHEFAQGFFSFITIPQSIILAAGDADAWGFDQRKTIAHELAHQWWGNMVGCAGDREAWLSESLASYAAVLYGRKMEKATDASVGNLLLEMLQQMSTASNTMVERPIEAMGPIALGTRLDSSLSAGAYETIIYKKGPKVLAMLADQLGEKEFLAMLREIAQRANFRLLDTDTMLAALSKMSGRNLDAFARSFVRGVGYPEIHFEYTMEPAEQGFAVRGTIYQVPRGFRRDRLVKTDGGVFDVVPEFREYQSAKDAQSLIPGEIAIDEAPSIDASGTRGDEPSVRGFKVNVQASGPETPFTLNVSQKPKEMNLDAREVLPTAVFNTTLDARGSYTAWAEALRSSGHGAEAREYYKKALALPPEDKSSNSVWKNKLANGWIHIELAEMAADEGRFSDAASELADHTVSLVKQSVRGGLLRYDAVRARLALHAGDATSAYKLLSGSLTLDVMQRETDTLRDDVRRYALKSGRVGFARDYLVYAVAAHATGHEEICREAAAEARRRGGDTSVLDALHSTGS